MLYGKSQDNFFTRPKLEAIPEPQFLLRTSLFALRSVLRTSFQPSSSLRSRYYGGVGTAKNENATQSTPLASAPFFGLGRSNKMWQKCPKVLANQQQRR